MARTFTVSRAQAIFGLCIPLAVLVGYLLARPYESTSLAILVFVFTAISCPLLLRWYHPALIVCWNAAIAPFFLPGRPYLWMLISVAGVAIAAINRAVDPERKLNVVSSLTWPLVFLTLVLLLTAATTGGMGTRTFGSEYYGGRKYFYILAAIAGYFALASKQVPAHKAKLWASLFFLSGITSVLANIAYSVGPKFYFLFDLFPPEFALPQAIGSENPYGGIPRVAGGMGAAIAVTYWLIAMYGIRGLFDLRTPWRLLLFIAVIPVGLLSGFRSFAVLLALVLLVQFFVEGLHRTGWALVAIAVVGIGGVVLVTHARKLPLPVQRAISFLPVDIDPVVQRDVEHSTRWRVEMWRSLLPEVPKYIFKGRGYAINPSDLYLAQEGVTRGLLPASEVAVLGADFHNGPLSVLIPFGIWGGIGMIWFFAAAGRVLYLNFCHGEPVLRTVNAALFSVFIAEVVFFLLFFGAIESDMHDFAGLVGLSVCLNGGARVQPVPAEQKLSVEEPQVAEQPV